MGSPKGQDYKIARQQGRKSIAAIREQIARGAREPLHHALSVALAGAPSKADWRRLARAEPHKWAAAIAQLGYLAGYQKQSVSVELSVDVSAIAAELTRRHGADQARRMIEAAGLPAELVPKGTTIDSEASPVESKG